MSMHCWRVGGWGGLCSRAFGVSSLALEENKVQSLLLRAWQEGGGGREKCIRQRTQKYQLVTLPLSSYLKSKTNTFETGVGGCLLLVD